jgi:hypothetical protein
MLKTLKNFLPIILVLTLSTLALGQNPTVFQVNMNVQEFLGNFNPGSDDIVVVRGSFNGWSGNQDQLTLSDSIYTCTVNIAATGGIEYKFVIVPGSGGNDVWESVSNRTYDVPSGGGTIPAVYFNNAGWNLKDIEVLFKVNMQVQILNGNFDPETDWVVVRGDNPAIGNWGGATRLYQEGGTTIYSAWIQFENLAVGQSVPYKFVILTDGNPDLATWESCDNRTFTVTGEEPDALPPPTGNGYGEIEPEVVYFSNITPDDIITADVMVEFHVDVRPAYYKIADPDSFIIDVQTGDTVDTIDEVDVAGYFNNWPWGSFAEEHKLYDDGVEPDITAGDSIFACAIQFYAGDPKELIYKYGLNGYDVEAGFAQNHSVMIDQNVNPFSWPADMFGSQGTLYTPYIAMIGVEQIPRPDIPTEFKLNQNYPNPFNPTTMISFTMPENGFANISVFNVKGERVFCQTTQKLTPGYYEYNFDASKLTSGVYFYQVKTANFCESKKMILLK